MRLWHFSLFLQVCLAARKKSESTSNPTSKDSGEARLSHIAKLDEAVSILTDANFTKFVSDRPRLYSAAIMFTALSEKYQCGICEMTVGVWADAARFYKNQYILNSTSPENRLVFFLVDVDSARSVFNKIGIESVPRTIALPQTTVNGAKQKIGDFELKQEALLEGVGSILAEIKAITGVVITKTMDPKPVLFVLGVLAVLLAWTISLAARDVQAALLWYRSSRIWILVSFVCFGVGVSGSIYCVIRSAPLYGTGRGGVSIFSGQNRDQYVIEGIILALFTLSAGMSLVAMHHATKIRFSLLRHVGVILCMSVFVVMALQIWSAYTDKTRWYSLKDTLPPSVWTWMTSTVKKNSGVFKRIWRLCEYWLLEYKDLEGLQKKAKILILDYVSRQYLGGGKSTTAST